MSAAWLNKVKQSVAWDGRDSARMTELSRWMAPRADELIEDVSEQLMQLKGRRRLMGNSRFARRLKNLLREWLVGLLDGSFDEVYLQDRMAFGRRLVNLDLTFEDLIVLEGLTRQRMVEMLQERSWDSSQALWSTMHTLNKAFNLDLGLIYNGYQEAHNAELAREQLDRFLAVTGFSPTLYESLVEARQWNEGVRGGRR